MFRTLNIFDFSLIRRPPKAHDWPLICLTGLTRVKLSGILSYGFWETLSEKASCLSKHSTENELRKNLVLFSVLVLVGACGPSGTKKEDSLPPAPADVEAPLQMMALPAQDLGLKIMSNLKRLEMRVALENPKPLDCFDFGQDIYEAFLILSRVKDPKSKLLPKNGNFSFGDLGGGRMATNRCPLLLSATESSWKKTYEDLKQTYSEVLPSAKNGSLVYDQAVFPRNRPTVKDVLDQIDTFIGESIRSLPPVQGSSQKGVAKIPEDFKLQGKVLFQMGRVFGLIDDWSSLLMAETNTSKKEEEILKKINNQMVEVRRDLDKNGLRSKSFRDRLTALRKTARKNLGLPEN